jgi:GH15 family glucan-1,4-alpha-glucosidase
MPRDLPVGNGSLLLNFDKSYNLRDIYWPHVGQELHTAGDISHTGVWVDGQFAWLDAAEGNTILYNPTLQALIAYKRQAYFLMNGQVGSGTNAHVGISSWATVEKA